jgi:hypothetical protein
MDVETVTGIGRGALEMTIVPRRPCWCSACWLASS